jgi:ubiquinone/menaquinone biosynthesis C-methylase UbiE
MARVDYDRMAADYLEGRALPAAGMESWRDAIAPWLPTAAGGPVLDLGAGTGQFAAAIAGWFGVEVVAVEPSGGMRRAARAFAHPGVAWVGGRAERLPLRDRSCSLAWVSTVVHHLDDLDAAAAELRRVLRPDGPVLVRQAFPGRMGGINLYRRFFPAAGERLVAQGALPDVERVVAGFAAAGGFRVEALQPVAQVSAPSLAAYRDKVRLRADTGLRLLPDDQFAAGLAALDRAVEAETTPRPVIDRLDLLVLR